MFLFPRHLQSQYELQCMTITKEIKYCYSHLQAFWPHSSWIFYFQYLKSSSPSVPLKKYLLHYWMHYSLEEGKKIISFYESFLSLLFTFSSLCASSFYDILNYFWPNTMPRSWKILFCHYFYQHFYSCLLGTVNPLFWHEITRSSETYFPLFFLPCRTANLFIYLSILYCFGSNEFLQKDTWALAGGTAPWLWLPKKLYHRNKNFHQRLSYPHKKKIAGMFLKLNSKDTL